MIMKNWILPGLILFLFTGDLFSQWSPNDFTILGTPYEVIIDFKTKGAGYNESYYLDDQWHNGSFTLLSDQTIKNYPVKYDLKNNNLEIQFSGEVKLLDIYRIKEFSWVDDAGINHRFININANIEDSKLSGIAQILYNGKVKLLKTYTYRPKPENDIKYGAYGAIDHNYILEKLYLVEGKKTMQVIRNKRKFTRFFDNYSSAIMNYIKSNNLKINKVADLKMIVEYYNSLISTVFTS
jgi:hypothetical protein